MILNFNGMKTMLKTSMFLFGLLIAVPFTGQCQEESAKPKEESGHEAEKEAARKAVDAWLELVDEGKLDKSWDAAALLFRENVSKNDWHKSLDGVRTPLGKVVSRTVAVDRYLTSLPGAPDGEYVVFQFKTEFENKKESVETVTPLNENGEWKVSGYFIK